MSNPLETMRRPGFPEETKDENSYRAVIEYIGDAAAIAAAGVTEGMLWPPYPGRITSARAHPIEGTSKAILTVIVELKAGSDDAPMQDTGDLMETHEEKDWVSVSRSLYQHPEFIVGGAGTYALTDQDVVDIKAWENEQDANLKALFQIQFEGGFRELSDNAIKFAQGLNLGVENWTDRAPLLRKTMTYKNGKGPADNAGQKESPDVSASLIPDGYEWIRETDRTVKRGGQQTYVREIEWIGAKKVLIDRDQIFW